MCGRIRAFREVQRKGDQQQLKSPARDHAESSVVYDLLRCMLSIAVHATPLHVNENNVRIALKAARRCIETFSADIRRLEQMAARASTMEELGRVVRSFHSIYRFHLFARLSNLTARMREELPKEPEKSHCSTAPLSASKTSVAYVNPSTVVSIPNSLSSGVTIDLTEENDCSNTALSKSNSSSSLSDKPPTSTASDNTPVVGDATAEPFRSSPVSNSDHAPNPGDTDNPVADEDDDDDDDDIDWKLDMLANLSQSEAPALIFERDSRPEENDQQTAQTASVENLNATNQSDETYDGSSKSTPFDLPQSALVPQPSVYLEDIRDQLGDNSYLCLRDDSSIKAFETKKTGSTLADPDPIQHLESRQMASIDDLNKQSSSPHDSNADKTDNETIVTDADLDTSLHEENHELVRQQSGKTKPDKSQEKSLTESGSCESTDPSSKVSSVQVI
ncbi:unnamed protein product [Echinostoma caproni]|uniref:L27 domain-containing protein n=1 Tax=Echinostoma caproni TaxID=27848 RepID=A0A183AQ38_9TREM|nr:unnamed protein product [Echinostoma caproni]